MSWNEANLHRWLAQRPRPARLAGSQGHDAAVLRPLRGRAVWCTDQVVLGVHLELTDPPRWLGRKAVDRTLSDLAACGAEPRGVLLALRLPAEWSEAQVRAVIRAADGRARALGAELLGGDLVAAPGPAAATVSALGELPARGSVPGRDRARPGQVLLLTGPVGGSRLGRHRRIEPRLAAGVALREAGATALMDVSDGLWLDASRLARASGVGLELELARLPLHRDAHRATRSSGQSALEHALGDGEDHELLATLAPRRGAQLLARGLEGCPSARVIGRVVEGQGLRLLDERGAPCSPPTRAGWLHGVSQG
jgi:thiamine-monophosphate kinase